MLRLKALLTTAISLLFLSSNAQYENAKPVPQSTAIRMPDATEFAGLIAYNYTEVDGNSGQKVVSKLFYMIYNSRYCKLYTNGKADYFPIDPSYERTLDKGMVIESFINAESGTIRRGWYSIRIEHTKNGDCTITINLPFYTQGHALIIEHAKAYSENGKINSIVQIGCKSSAKSELLNV